MVRIRLSPAVSRANSKIGRQRSSGAPGGKNARGGARPPQSAEARVHPTIEIVNTDLIPNRVASQPDSGIVITAVMMYEVSTHVT